MDTLAQIAQFILSLSLLIVLHEMGHFVPARLFKTRVEKFYLFFNPWFSLFKKKIGQTEYGLGWLPLGGYVKIAGMVDESMDKKAMKEPPKPDEFRSKKAWQRLIIMLGGVTVNVILGIVIWAMIMWVWGDSYVSNRNLTWGVAVDSTMQELGLRDGDKVLAIDGQPVERLNHVVTGIIFNKAQSVTVQRDGVEMNIALPEGSIKKMIAGLKNDQPLIEARFPVVADSVEPGSVAAEAGLRNGDRIIAIDSMPVSYYHEFNRVKEATRGQQVTVSVLRASDTVELHAMMPTGTAPFGFRTETSKYLSYDTIGYGFFAAFPAGLSKATTTLSDYWKQIKLMFSSEVNAAESVGGFISIGKVFSPDWDWKRFWIMTAWLSIILAFMNLLPIPALDGGHVMFLLVEVATGRKLPDKVLEYAQVVGMVLLLSLIVFANGADIIRLFK